MELTGAQGLHTIHSGRMLARVRTWNRGCAMTLEALKLLITASLFLHAVAHGIAFLALVKEMLGRRK